MKRGCSLVMVVVAAGAASGCAGLRSGRDVQRLQSQLALLDRRVTQLERGSPTWQAQEPVAEAVMVAPQPAAVAPGASKDAGISIKPTTREIQEALKNAGFYQGAIDGKMGPLTREAVKEFQRVHGLTDDGIVGKKTWAKLNQYATLSSSEPSAAEILK